MKKIKLSFLLIVSLFIITSCSENETSTSNSSSEPTDTSQNITDITTEAEETKPTVDPNAEGFDIGNLAPDFEIELLTGETVKLSDFRDKAVILNFWATWCGPCKREMPDLQKIQDDYPEEVVVLGISVGEERQLVEEFVDNNNYTFNIAADELAKTGYPILAFPTTFFLDKNGRIIDSVMAMKDYDYFEEKIKEALNTNIEEETTDVTEATSVQEN